MGTAGPGWGAAAGPGAVGCVGGFGGCGRGGRGGGRRGGAGARPRRDGRRAGGGALILVVWAARRPGAGTAAGRGAPTRCGGGFGAVRGPCLTPMSRRRPRAKMSPPPLNDAL